MENSTKKRRKKRGFTLIELIIVLAVMGIIALIAIPSLSGTKENFKIKADKRSCETIERAIKVVIVGDDTLPDDPSFEVSFDGTTATISNITKPAGYTGTAELKTAIESALKDVKAPQSKPGGSYVITVTNGTVKAIAKEKTE